MADHYYYAPVYDENDDGQQIRSPGSVEAWYALPGDVDPDTGEISYGDPVQQWSSVSIAGARYFFDVSVPRFVVKSPTEQTYSDWTEVTADQVEADYGSEVV